MPKTNAEYCRDYRKRKRQNKMKKTAKSSTERVREFRARRKALLNVENKSSITHNDDFTVQNSESDHKLSSIEIKMYEVDVNLNLSLVKDEPREIVHEALGYIKVENDNADGSMSFMDYNTGFKQEVADLDLFEPSVNEYDTSFIICKEELEDDKLEMMQQTSTDLQVSADSKQAIITIDILPATTDDKQINTPLPKTEDVGSDETYSEKNNTKINKLRVMNEIVSSEEKIETLNRVLQRKRNTIEYVCPYEKSSTLLTKQHINEKPFTCNHCNYKCERKAHLLNHIRTHHTITSDHNSDKSLICKLCSYKCRLNCSLVVHMRTHTGEKPFSCAHCSYKTARRRYLISHMKIHTGEKPFSCKLCSYRGVKKSYLISHMNRHAGEKPFTCKVCSFKSRHKVALSLHARIHSGEKPFSCKLCSYKCRRNSSLIIHMRTHTGEKPFSCNLCGYKSGTRSSLKRHINTHTVEKVFS